MFRVFEWSLLLLQCNVFVVIVLSDELKQNQGRGLVDRILVKAAPPPQYFYTGRPKAALLFWWLKMWCVVILYYLCKI